MSTSKFFSTLKKSPIWKEMEAFCKVHPDAYLTEEGADFQIYHAAEVREHCHKDWIPIHKGILKLWNSLNPKNKVSAVKPKLKMHWYRVHVRWHTDTGAADIFFCVQATDRKEAWMKGTDIVEDLVPSICEGNYTMWPTLLPGYRPSKMTSWKQESTNWWSVVPVIRG